MAHLDPLSIYLFNSERYTTFSKDPSKFPKTPNEKVFLQHFKSENRFHKLDIWIEELTDKKLVVMFRNGMNGLQRTIKLFHPISINDYASCFKLENNRFVARWKTVA